MVCSAFFRCWVFVPSIVLFFLHFLGAAAACRWCFCAWRHCTFATLVLNSITFIRALVFPLHTSKIIRVFISLIFISFDAYSSHFVQFSFYWTIKFKMLGPNNTHIRRFCRECALCQCQCECECISISMCGFWFFLSVVVHRECFFSFVFFRMGCLFYFLCKYL